MSPQTAGHLYIHVPFCRSRCSYCAFSSSVVAAIPEKEYLAGLEIEFNSRLEFWPGADLPLATLYFGGGTPSLLSPYFYSRIIDLCTDKLGFVTAAEITLEANPADLSYGLIRGYRAAGINRLSLGAQTFAPAGLQLLGRRHDGRMIEKAVDQVRRGGMENLSLDLIYAWPGQDLAGLQADLHKISALAPEHVSAYSLSLEPGTRLAQMVAAGEVQALSEETQVEMMGLLARGLENFGLYRYEVSNFAREPRLQARHNLAYWHLEDFLGLGAGACGGWYCRRNERHWAERYCNVSDPLVYLRRLAAAERSSRPDCETWCEKELIDRNTSLIEALMMGLRLREGAALAALQAEYGAQAVAAVMARAQPFLADGLLAETENNLSITDKGLFLSDTILSFLL
ncbi:MAG: radical SAM family heme chaperone HemW [Deltaproteobacteria bacterium]|nr:radical SAM family heme chaperone HemW [Deltaproteobacteria bacterium]